MTKKNKFHKYAALLLALCTAFMAMAPAFATSEEGAACSSSILGNTYSPIGTLSEDECRNILEKSAEYCTSCPVPYHWDIISHKHTVTNVNWNRKETTPVGSDKDGLVTRRRKGEGSGDLEFSKSYTVSNDLVFSAEFDNDVISATLGFDVGYSTTATASFSLHLEDNQGGEIYCWNVYDVYTFTGITTWYTQAGTYDVAEDGEAWQWTIFEYDSAIF